MLFARLNKDVLIEQSSNGWLLKKKGELVAEVNTDVINVLTVLNGHSSTRRCFKYLVVKNKLEACDWKMYSKTIFYLAGLGIINLKERLYIRNIWNDIESEILSFLKFLPQDDQAIIYASIASTCRQLRKARLTLERYKSSNLTNNFFYWLQLGRINARSGATQEACKCFEKIYKSAIVGYKCQPIVEYCNLLNRNSSWQRLLALAILGEAIAQKISAQSYLLIFKSYRFKALTGLRNPNAFRVFCQLKKEIYKNASINSSCHKAILLSCIENLSSLRLKLYPIWATKQFLRRFPTCGMGWLTLGNLLTERNDYKGAMEAFAMSKRLGYDSRTLLTRIASTLMKQGKYEDVAAYERLARGNLTFKLNH